MKQEGKTQTYQELIAASKNGDSEALLVNVLVRPGLVWWLEAEQFCPECGEQKLHYDGSVKWRSGPPPGRSLATTEPVGFSPRADFEIAHYFHCASYGTLFYDPVDGSRPYLSIETPVIDSD